MTPKQQRLAAVIAIAALLGLAVWLVLTALRDNIVFFYTPSEIPSGMENRAIRLGGLVKEGSVDISFSENEIPTLFCASKINLSLI